MTFLSQQYGGCFIRLDTMNIDVSSRHLRQWLQEGKSLRYYVPDSVIEYIRKNNIYQTENRLV